MAADELGAIYLGYRASIFLCGLAGFLWLALRGGSALRLTLAWLGAAAAPWLSFIALHALTLPEEGRFPAYTSKMHLLWPMAAATGMLLLYAARWRQGWTGRLAAASLAAGTLTGAAMSAVGSGTIFGLPRFDHFFDKQELFLGLAFAVACFILGAAAAKRPVSTRRGLRALAAAPVLVFLAVAGRIEEAKPRSYWSTPRLLAALDSDPPPMGSCLGTSVNRARQKAAAAALAQKGPAAVPSLREALGPGQAIRIRTGAAMALAALGPAAEPAVPELLAAMQKNSGSFEAPLDFEASRALAAIGRPAIPSLLAAVKKRQASASNAGFALSRMGAPGRVAAFAAARHADEEVRSMAARALGYFGDGDEKAVRALGALAADPSWSVSWSATFELTRLGLKGSAAAPALARALAKGDAELRLALALASISPANQAARDWMLRRLERPHRLWDSSQREDRAEIFSALSGYKKDQRVTAALERALARERAMAGLQVREIESALKEQRGG